MTTRTRQIKLRKKAINLLRKYMYSIGPSSVSNDTTYYMYLNRIENVIIRNNSTRTRQSTIKDFCYKEARYSFICVL
ncbi:hypothetical protein C0J52_22951 [Blattella germanica]|nr:hypothetical protein C0J52_22951 [Blattella germanica]